MTSSSLVLWRWVLAVFFVLAGANHFLNPMPYLSMVPPCLPSPAALVWISGVAEVMGGVGLLLRALRRFAGWGLIALLTAVFPANLYVALHGWRGVDLPGWVLWLRLPLQIVFIWWAYRVGVAGGRQRGELCDNQDQNA